MFPLEVCTVVPGQQFARKLNELQTANMIKYTCTKPNDRQRKIQAGLSELGLRDTPQLNDLGISIDDRMIQAKARVLDPPSLRYQGSTLTPQFGQWNMRDRIFSSGGVLSHWGVLVVGEEREFPPPKVQGFVVELCNMAKKTGMRVEHARPPIEYTRSGGESLDRAMSRVSAAVQSECGSPIRFLLAIIRGETDIYGKRAKFGLNSLL